MHVQNLKLKWFECHTLLTSFLFRATFSFYLATKILPIIFLVEFPFGPLLFVFLVLMFNPQFLHSEQVVRPCLHIADTKAMSYTKSRLCKWTFGHNNHCVSIIHMRLALINHRTRIYRFHIEIIYLSLPVTSNSRWPNYIVVILSRKDTSKHWSKVEGTKG